jgi:SAM-dependent methyltransferase
MLPAPCDYCGRDHPVALATFRPPAWAADPITLVRCQLCDYVYVDPRPAVELLVDWFRTAAAAEGWERVLLPLARGASPLIVRRLASPVGKGRLLDVGCADPEWLGARAAAGWRVSCWLPYGLERPLPEGVVPLSASGSARFPDQPAASFDAIVFSCGVGIFDDLRSVLFQAWRRLAPGGLLALRVPPEAQLQRPRSWERLPVPVVRAFPQPRHLQGVMVYLGAETIELWPRPDGWVRRIAARFRRPAPPRGWELVAQRGKIG